MKSIFLIGETEKHEVEIYRSQWTNKVVVKIDGEIASRKTLWKKGTFFTLEVGEREKHEIELKYSGIYFPKVKCFVDGKPHLREAVILSKWQKPVKFASALLIILLVSGVGYLWFLSSGAKLPPYNSIENRTVHMVFKASNGNLHEWTIGLDTLEAQIKYGYLKRELIPGTFLPILESIENLFVSLTPYTNQADIQKLSAEIDNFRSLGTQYIELTSKTGENYRVMDFRPFIVENNFESVISDLYHEMGNNDQAFVHEVWFIVTQLTTYNSEIEETPRFPLETLIGGGGDCEDMAILIASMLKAAPANYTVNLVYMDADNPTSPKQINHVTVWVETPSGYKTFVEGTEHVEMNPYTEVNGWYFEV